MKVSFIFTSGTERSFEIDEEVVEELTAVVVEAKPGTLKLVYGDGAVVLRVDQIACTVFHK